MKVFSVDSQTNNAFNSTYERGVKKKSNGNHETFHMATSTVLFCFQFFAIMPVSGLRKSDCSQVKFKWILPMVVYCVIFIFASTTRLLIHIYNLSVLHLKLENVDTLFYYFYVWMASIMFLLLARKWPKLIKFWHKTDLIFLNDIYPQLKIKMSMKIRIVAVTGFLILIIGFGLSILYERVKWEMIEKSCITANKTINLPISLSKIIHTNVWAYTYFLYIDICSSMHWCYTELFVIFIAIGVGTRFKQINMRLEGIHLERIADNTWSEIRTDYILLCELLEEIDNCISFIVLMSCTNNLCLICLYVLRIFHKQYHIIQILFNWYTVTFLILRTMLMFLSAATINDESKGILKILQKIPTGMWCVEIERFIWLVKSQTVALTGMKFFHLTRTLLFEMAGTIVTYELVLLQIDQPAGTEKVFTCVI